MAKVKAQFTVLIDFEEGPIFGTDSHTAVDSVERRINYLSTIHTNRVTVLDTRIVSQDDVTAEPDDTPAQIGHLVANFMRTLREDR